MDKKQKETERWGVWSEGNISFGRIGQQDGNLGQDIHSDGVTFGVDKKINDEKTIGFAISKSWQETEVGSNEGSMDAAAINIMNYTSLKIEDKRFFEMVAGIGEMDIDLSRNVTGGKNSGKRKGNQFFGSFTYLLEPDIEIVGRNLNYYTFLQDPKIPNFLDTNYNLHDFDLASNIHSSDGHLLPNTALMLCSNYRLQY